MDAIKRAFQTVAMYTKAIVAIATPFVVQFLADIAPSLVASNERLISVIGTALLVFVVPNAKRPVSPTAGIVAPEAG
jgi:hypothetical protein